MCGSATLLAHNTWHVWQCHGSRAGYAQKKAAGSHEADRPQKNMR